MSSFPVCLLLIISLIRLQMNNSPLHKISSSDSGSLSLGFSSPISIRGVLFNLERTTLQREHNTLRGKVLEVSAIRGSQVVMKCARKTSRTNKQAAAFGMCSVEQVLTS